MNEKELRQRALDHDCPDCGANAGVRCRTHAAERHDPEAHHCQRQAQPVPRANAVGMANHLKEER
jgi:hypothetical protein